MVLDHVEPSLRRWQPGDPVHSDHPAPPQGQRQGVEEPTRPAVLGFGALARLARSHVLSDIDVLSHPKGEAPHQRPRLGRGGPPHPARCGTGGHSAQRTPSPSERGGGIPTVEMQQQALVLYQLLQLLQ